VQHFEQASVTSIQGEISEHVPERNQRVDARSTHGRTRLFDAGEKPSPAYLAGRVDADEIGSQGDAPLDGRAIRISYFCF
jgi:hypothetical protein